MDLSTLNIIIYIAVMAITTYLIRMLPLAIFKKKIENRFIKSFLFYVPYAVLTVMTIPDIFSSTANMVSAVAGLCMALFLAWRGKSLVAVALSACATVFLVEQLMAVIAIYA